MATDITTPYYFWLELWNYVDNGYARSDLFYGYIGMYDRDGPAGYVDETLVQVDVSGIPAGSTITDVNLEIYITDNAIPSAFSAKIREQDQGSWIDDNPNEPTYENPFVDSVMPILRSHSISAFDSGWESFGSSAALVALWQDFLDGAKTAHDGVVLTMDTSAVGYFIEFDAVRVTVTYDLRRRVVVIT